MRTEVARAREGIPAESLDGVSITFMAVAAALATSTSYLVQPELEKIAGDMRSSLPVVSVVAASAIVGYMLGLAFLVPLVDQIRPNLLVAGQLSGLTAGLLIAAAAPNSLILGVGLFVSGVCASTGAQLSTLAGKYSAPGRRGLALGVVTAGISAGILLGRVLGGALADWFGWRLMILVFAAACLLLAIAAYLLLPKGRVLRSESYLVAIRSLPTLPSAHRALRVFALSGALWFFSFSLVWVSLSFALSQLGVSPTVIGLYALAGLLGIATTLVAGPLVDRYGTRKVILGSLALSFVCATVMVFVLELPPVLLASLALFDAGLFAAQVANQGRVLGIDPLRPAKFNSVYMVIYFVGGSMGTAVGGGIVHWLGWPAAALLAAVAIAAAAVISRTRLGPVR